MHENDCHCSDPNKKLVNHAVTVVGYGVAKEGVDRPDCKEYWWIKNSWGPDWGMNGLFRMCMDYISESVTPVGQCQVNSYV